MVFLDHDDQDTKGDMMIQPLKQRKNECWVTSLAMVTGKAVDELLKEFETLAGMEYHASIAARRPDGTQDFTWFQTANTMMKQYGFQGQPGSTFATGLFDTPFLGLKRVNLTESLLHGKGILGVALGKRTAHAVAFEDGKIYEPNCGTGGLPFKEWKKLYRVRVYRWRIDRCQKG